MICFIEKKLIKINNYFFFKKAMKYGIYFTTIFALRTTGHQLYAKFTTIFVLRTERVKPAG